MTCDKAGAGDWQPVGLSVATVTTVRHVSHSSLQRENTREFVARPDGLAAFFLQAPGLARVRSTRAKPPVPILDLGGYELW